MAKRPPSPCFTSRRRNRQTAAATTRDGLIARPGLDREHYSGTITQRVTPRAEVCGVTTTSGLAWKIPGRAGDSPILGAGLYVDGDVRRRRSNGRGAANPNLSSFRSSPRCGRGATHGGRVPHRASASPHNTMRSDCGRPTVSRSFGELLLIEQARADTAGVSMYDSTYAVCTRTAPAGRARPRRGVRSAEPGWAGGRAAQGVLRLELED